MKKDDFLRYVQLLAMLGELLHRELITQEEYNTIKREMMKDYKVVSDSTITVDPD